MKISSFKFVLVLKKTINIQTRSEYIRIQLMWSVIGRTRTTWRSSLNFFLDYMASHYLLHTVTANWVSSKYGFPNFDGFSRFWRLSLFLIYLFYSNGIAKIKFYLNHMIPLYLCTDIFILRVHQIVNPRNFSKTKPSTITIFVSINYL